MIEVLLILMIIFAALALVLPDLLVSVILLSVFSLISCLFFFLLGAPDVALTEAAVGTGIGTVVFIWTVQKTQRRRNDGDAS
ncbi:MAG: Na(+)/H(+) antiporter subunit B [Alkalispirochaeta sp.]